MIALRSAVEPYLRLPKVSTSTMARKTQGGGIEPCAYNKTYHTRRFINFASSTPEQLDHLAGSCEKATFGRGSRDVYDESYRKALKMDSADFAVQFYPTASGLIKTIEGSLLQGQTEKMLIKPEIYKLNVYGRLLRLLVINFLTTRDSQAKTPSLKRTRTLPVARICLGHL